MTEDINDGSDAVGEFTPRKERGVLGNWECEACGLALGWHPRGTKLNCPGCNQELFLPGFDSVPVSDGTIKFLAELKKRLRKEALERYRAMREG